MANPTVFFHISDLHHLLDRIQYAQHGSTAFVRSTLTTAISALTSALVDVAKFLETADNNEQQFQAAESVSEILRRSIPTLESHLEVFERGHSNSGRGRSQTSWVCRRQHSREERRICHSIQNITTRVLRISSMTGVPNSNLPLAAGSEDNMFHNRYRATGGWPMEHNTSHNHYRTTRRDETPPRGRYRHRTNDGRRAQFQDEPAELPGHSFRTESPPLTADEQPTVLPANVRGGRIVNLSDDDQGVSSDEEIHTDGSEDDVPGRFSPSYSPPDSPPPPYTPLQDPLTDDGDEDNDSHADENEWDHPSPDIPAQSLESDEAWINPIIAGCRDVIHKEFPTADTSAIDDYDEYRRRTLSSPSYKWCLNFRYMSLVLQLELPCQVLLTHLKTYKSDRGYGPDFLVTYLFEDCIIFADFPFCPDLPDSNGAQSEGHLSRIKHRGLLVLEKWPIRFKDMLYIRKAGTNVLIIEVSTSTDEALDASLGGTEVPTGRVRHVLVFETPHRDQVFRALLPWVTRNNLANPGRRDTRSESQDADISESPESSDSSLSTSSRSSSIERTPRTIFERPVPAGPSHSRVQVEVSTSEFTYHLRSFGGPSRGPQNYTAATPRSASASHDPHAHNRVPNPEILRRSEREFRFGIFRLRVSRSG